MMSPAMTMNVSVLASCKAPQVSQRNPVTTGIVLAMEVATLSSSFVLGMFSPSKWTHV